MNKTFMFQCNPISFNLKKFNYRTIFGKKITDTLVQYDPTNNTITVDERADPRYIKYAAIHECICCGRYQHLAPEMENPYDRCGGIDWMIVTSMPQKDREWYLEKRIEMFRTLIDRKLNPEMTESFRHSKVMLEKLLDNIRSKAPFQVN